MAEGEATVVVADTAEGPIEYADLGAGSPVLFVHGSPGGWDEGELMTRFLVEAGFRVVSPSRPGYLGTPLTDHNGTPEGQAALEGALMDSLGIERFAVTCWSGGGPSSYRLAASRPEQVTALVAIAAVSGSYAFASSIEGHILERRLGRWMIHEMVKHSAKSLIKSTLAEEGTFDKHQLKALVEEVWADDGKRAFVLALAEIVAGRRVGLENDKAQFPKIDDLDLASVAAPVLLVHGTGDADVPFEHSDRAAALLPHVARHTIEGGSHISAWAGPGEVEAQAAIVSFLREQAV